jgi:DNA-binding CsgD family transcriptional regulator
MKNPFDGTGADLQKSSQLPGNMERLTSRSARTLSELLLAVYEPLSLAEYRPRMLECIGRAIDHEMLCHNEINGPGGASISVLRPEVENFEALRAVFFQHAHEHPSLGHLIATGDTRAVKTSDFISQREFRSRAIYREFYRKLRVRYQLTFGFQADSGALAFVAVSRWHTDFTEQERAVLSLFRPHFIQAYRRAASRQTTHAANGNGLMPLSTREREVLHWLSEGKTNADIAQILGVSLATVKTHVGRIFEKLHVETRTAACRVAWDEARTS